MLTTIDENLPPPPYKNYFSRTARNLILFVIFMHTLLLKILQYYISLRLRI